MSRGSSSLPSSIAMRSELVEVGGPENLSMRQVAQTFETVTGKVGRKSHVPLPMMR